MDISDNQVDLGVTPSLDQQPTSGLLKRKLSTLKSSAALDGNNAGNDEATSNKRRKSSRTSGQTVGFNLFIEFNRF